MLSAPVSDRARAASRTVCSMPSRPIAARTTIVAADHLRVRRAGGGVQCALRAGQPALGDVAVAAGDAGGRGGQGEDGPRGDLLVVEAVQPPLDRRVEALPAKGRNRPPEQAQRRGRRRRP